MGKGDQKSKRGKITAGSYGKRRPKKSGSAKNIPVNVLDDEDKKAAKTKVRKEVGYPTDKSENADVKTEPKAKAKPKAEKETEAKPKAEKAADPKPKAEKESTKTSAAAKADKETEEPKEAKPKAAKAKKTEE